MIYDFCIVGAGITGIQLAKELDNVVILEKSRALGGRLASRRLQNHSLNHGPDEFFQPDLNRTITDPHAWIKQEAEGLTIYRSWEVSHLEFSAQSIKVVSKEGLSLEAKKVILTAPAPQSQMILTNSGLEADFLMAVQYKAIIQLMLLTTARIIPCIDEYLIQKKQKSLGEDKFLTLYEMKDPFLQKFIDMDKEEIKNLLLKKANFEILDGHVHKWRYSEVLHPIRSTFQTHFSDKNILLAGDYFGNVGIAGALQSIKNLFKLIKQEDLTLD